MICLRALGPARRLSLLRNASTQAPQNTLSSCVDIVKANDYEHLLCALLLPSNARAGAIALRALNVELSRAAVGPGSNENQIVNQMKLQFWADQISNIYQGRKTVRSPVALELALAVKHHKLTKGFLMKLIDSRRTYTQYNSIHDVETMGDSTFGAVNILTMELLGLKGVDFDHAASHLGRCESIIALLRSIPVLRTKGAVLVPNTTLAKHGVSQQDFINGENIDGIKEAVFDLASSASVHADHAEVLGKTLTTEAKLALLPLTAARRFLERLRKYDFDVYNDRAMERAPLLPLVLKKNAVLGRVC